jgi:predicted nucleotidyltransferase component of viral defense system
LQIDIGFDDVVSPAPVVKPYPVILSMPVPALRSYPPEAVVAEKLQAMIYLGSANSRMKDFYDLWIFARMIEFKGEVLQDAIRRTFEHRDTDVPENEPVAFSERFAIDKQDLWLAFVKTSSIKDAPEQVETVIAHLRKFISPVFESIRTDMKFTKTWSADGPWK